ncbi:MAG: carboxypeptidase-like regulatory domain-containing protein [Flavobacteriaceae bacterium]
MKNQLLTFLAIYALGFTLTAQGQNLNQDQQAQLRDSISGESIPYATILIGQQQGIISNDQGFFNFDRSTIRTPLDSIEISSLGYQSVKIPYQSNLDTIIYLEPMTYDLNEVFISAEKLEVKDIIERMITKLDQNYPEDLFSNRFFYRKSELSSVKKMELKLKESTLEGFDKAFLDSVVSLIPKNSAYYYEMVGNRQGNFKKGKIEILKGAELYDKEKDLSFEGISEKMEQIFTDNVKTDSYLKIKSGIFSTKVQLDSILDSSKDMEEAIEEVKEKEGEYQYLYLYSSIENLVESLFISEDSKVDIIDKSSRYRWTLRGVDQIENESVYRIDFEPRGSKDFEGTVYVNMEDFGIMRLDFTNVKPLSKFNLLGLSFSEFRYNGRVIFEKQGHYRPKYIELTHAESFGIKRPLKVIEKNKNVKGRRKQNEIHLKLDMKMLSQTKHELVFFNPEPVTKEAYKAWKIEKDFKPTYLERFDAEFWSDYLIIEPNAAIKSFDINN